MVVLNENGAKVARNDTAEVEEGARGQKVKNPAVSFLGLFDFYAFGCYQYHCSLRALPKLLSADECKLFAIYG